MFSIRVESWSLMFVLFMFTFVDTHTYVSAAPKLIITPQQRPSLYEPDGLGVAVGTAVTPVDGILHPYIVP